MLVPRAAVVSGDLHAVCGRSVDENWQLSSPVVLLLASFNTRVAKSVVLAEDESRLLECYRIITGRAISTKYDTNTGGVFRSDISRYNQLTVARNVYADVMGNTL